jgi:hypothetical protein
MGGDNGTSKDHKKWLLFPPHRLLWILEKSFNALALALVPFNSNEMI